MTAPEKITDEQELILEQTFMLDPASAATFDSWLRDHLADLLQQPGCLGADIAEVDDPPGRTISLRLKSRAHLDALRAQPQANTLALAKERFGDTVHGSARVLRPKEALAAGATTDNCPNCGELLTGQYCAFCGQRAAVRVVSLWILLKELVGDIVNADSRVWRTLRPLVISPGTLTNEYLRGKRASFTPPFRLYLFLSLAGFLVSSVGTHSKGHIGGNIVLKTSGNTEANFRLDSDGPQHAKEREENLASLKQLCGEVNEAPKDWWDRQALAMAAACRKAVGDPSSFVHEFRANSSKQMFVLLPVLALVGSVLYRRSRRFYVEHLLFFVHLVCFATVVEMAANLLRLAASLGPGGVRTALDGLLAFVTFTGVAIYAFLAMREVYGQGPVKTLVKLGIIGGTWSVLYAVATIGFFVFTILTF